MFLFCSPVSDRPPEPVLDVVAVHGSYRPLPRPAQLPLHGMWSETLRLAAAERLCLPQFPEGKDTPDRQRSGISWPDTLKHLSPFPQICENYGPNLDTCPERTVLGLLVDTNSCLHLYVNGMDQGVAAQDIPSPCYPFIDLYGQCEQVSAMNLFTFVPEMIFLILNSRPVVHFVKRITRIN